MEKNEVKNIISETFNSSAPTFSNVQIEAINTAIEWLDKGTERVCSRTEEGQWKVNQWLKEAILLFFRIKTMRKFRAGDLHFYDKIPLKEWGEEQGVRVVPHAVVRQGAFVEKGAILMPSYVNIGAYVGSGSMVDTWATVGSCAQIGKNVHLSGGVGIGGVLEPVQAQPVIIEDNAFIGSRCIVVEGIIVEEGSVLGAGVTLTASTRIIDVTQNKAVEYKGRIPKNSVVIPGMRTKNFPAGEFQVPCALIIGQRSESTDKKTSLTSALRDFEVSV
ncbi:MAG: 2,3,4,5-tetrahydropyridine-2,6-dicarboxylate N-succinyltransferase [Bdellovibrionaceae bacterium]|nr:2,3,4,5-tetrahydropyridine-2,6-dicarboxylate N-succinyltransferase [Pseudobdellovibrionaceae bacterium]MCB9092896.1 2,3,4,5-tetrahydropyridine-2,6-dicarboxylate N-succinyltransferase [Halobacteriovoraceae bacterium]